jgi:hypothetical protein
MYKDKIYDLRATHGRRGFIGELTAPAAISGGCFKEAIGEEMLLRVPCVGVLAP